MTKIVFATALAILMISSDLVGGLPHAAPGGNGRGGGGGVDNSYGKPTYPRRTETGVLPSQPPGPFVNRGFNEAPRDDRPMGLRVGDVRQSGRAAGLNGQETMDLIC